MEMNRKNGKQLYIESYGCAMNFSDSEVVASIMAKHGYEMTTEENDADVIFLNTCSIRDNAEQRIRGRLQHLRSTKRNKADLKIGVLGCMAERLKTKLLEEEKLVDVVAGPDAYRSLPELLAETEEGSRAINVVLSLEETYGEITPVRLDQNGVTAFISITRGCDNMCSFCVVPFTRGRERSRSPETIVQEARDLVAQGYKEITLLGQNVDSYLWYGGGPKKDFKKLTLEQQESSVNFANLLEMMAKVNPELRIRFSTSHPKDITEEVVHVMAAYENICNYIHLPAQSGNSRILDKMNRNYTREWYMDKVNMIRGIIPDCGISCDIIAGFCTETEEEHQDTLTLIEWAAFDFSYMYYYSERPGTLAAKKYSDDVPLETKKRRLAEIIEVQHKQSKKRNEERIGTVQRVLVERTSKRSDQDFVGKCDQNINVVFPRENYEVGDYVDVRIESCSTTTLVGKPVGYSAWKQAEQKMAEA
jgi:tRNA-2-methylthio-N6-dimethylallyladenosine synthase